MSVLQLFAASALAVVLPIGAIRAEEARAQQRGNRQHNAALSALTRVREGEQELLHMALHDDGTAMLNRIGMANQLAQMAAPPSGELRYVATLGIERFTALRSALGSEQADILVKQAGKRIATYMPDSVVARTSPEELAISFSADTRPSARYKMDRLRAQFVEPFIHQWQRHRYAVQYRRCREKYSRHGRVYDASSIRSCAHSGP